MKLTEMEELLVFPQEIPMHQALFKESPLWIAKLYLDCFDTHGRQARRVPRFVLEAMAKRFLVLFDDEAKTLDEAFGGKVRRQRNHLAELERRSSVSWAVRTTLEQVRSLPRSERGAGTPFEIAVERVAGKLGMSPDNVRRIYKAAATG